MAAQTERGIPLSALSPKFLHTNSTSHTWPFSAIAELIDNAYDPDVSAKQFWIDKTRIKGLDCLTFMDNGSGINYDKMHKMLSFGFSDKQTINGHIPVGLYGNGFKSGSMRLGKDALVFSKTRDTMSVGLLSQSYLEAIQAQHVVVPIVTFRRVGQNQFRAASEHTASLQDILRYSLFKSENELFSELRAINSTCSTGSTGTRIIIWNLRRMSNGLSEFDFNKDRYDIQIPADVFESTSEMYKRQDRTMQSVPESDYSLRAYCSILYLKPRMQIVIRGQKVKTQLISKSLAYIAKDYYRPIFLNKRIRITFGYNTKSKEQYGIMMYHKNRLIKAYERVGCQLKANIKGVGVIGVIECNFLKPTHNKQDFDYTDEYRKTINNLGVKLEEYWNEIRYKRDREDPNCSIPVEDTMKRPDQNWVQCDNCLRWRKLPDGIDCSLLPEKWFCHMNPDPQFRTCQVEEEPEDSDDDQPSYQKTYKQQERYNKMQQERSRLQMEQAKKKADMQRIAALAEQNEVLRRQHEDLKRQLKQSNFRATIPPNTPATPSISSTVRGELRPLVTSAPLGHKASCSPSANNMPIISNVCSLSTPARMKRTAMNPDSMEMKRARISSLHSSTAEATDATVSTEPPSSPVIIPSDDDDDIVIIETNSTPRPGAPTFDLAKVKTEHKVTEVTGMHLECSDDAAVETPMEMDATPKVPSSSPLPQLQTSATTQTDSAARVKEEDEAKRKKEEGTTAGEETTPQEEKCGNNIDVTANTSKAEVEEVAVKEETKGQLDERQDEEEEKGEEVASVEQGELRPEQENVDEVAVTEAESVVERVAPIEGMAVIEAEQKEERLLLEAQQQQDQLMELMQATAQERDGYKEQVHQLTCRIVDLETQLLELTGSVVKKELCDQATATDWLEGEEEGAATPGSKSEQELSKVCQQAKQEVEELKQHQEAFGTSRFGSTSSCKINSEERGATEVSDEDVLALQVDTLLRDLDHCSKEREDLQRRLESMEAEKNNLSSQCELLQKELRERAAANEPGSPTSGDVDQTGPTSPSSADVDQAGPNSLTSGDVDQAGPASPISGDEDQAGPTSPTSGDEDQAGPTSPTSGDEDQAGPTSPTSGDVDHAGPTSPSSADVDQAGPTSPTSGGVDQNGTGNHSGAETQNGATSLTSAEIQNGVSSPVAGAVTPVPSDETTRKLRNLRMSIGRLLVTFVPALELDQVNYDCEVIDEILDQVLDEVSLTETA